MEHAGTAAHLLSLASPDPAAGWSQLVIQHGPAIWSLIRGLSRGQHEAEDAYQEFWLRLPTAATGFTPAASGADGAARAWLMRVAYTTAMNRHRRQRAERAEPLADLPAGEEAPMEDREAREVLAAQVRNAINDLPENHRRPLVLHLIGGLGYEELAADLRCSAVNARVRVHRALKRVRERLGVREDALTDRALRSLWLPLMAPPAVHFTAPAAAGGAAAGTSAAAGAHLGFAGLTGAKLALLGACLVALPLAGVAVMPGRGDAPTPVSTAASAASTTSATAPAPSAPRAAVAGGTASHPVAVRRVPIDDFEREREIFSHNGALFSLVPAQDGASGTALEIGWPAMPGRFVDVTFPQPVPVAGLVDVVHGAAVFRLWQPAGSPLRNIAIRFADKWNQTFQWGANLPPATVAGWREVRIPLAADTFVGRWGGVGIDYSGIVMPLRFIGFGFDFTTPERPAGSVQFDDLMLEEAVP